MRRRKQHVHRCQGCDGYVPVRHVARKRFGQNFLHDQQVINRIIASIAPQPTDLLVEIGPGQAALTRPLLDSGAGHKLERFGTQTVIRPDPQAFWPPARPLDSWDADARFDAKAGDDERGHWRLINPAAPDAWPMHSTL